MRLLSRSEEIILLTIIKLEGNAYGISIRELIRESTGSEWSLASIYEPLDKLKKKGYVQKYRGDPSPDRGGRHKCLYEITGEGKAALLDIYRIHKNVWDGVPIKTLT